MSQQELSTADCNRIEDFVRDTLGCACPPAIFENVLLHPVDSAFAAIQGTCLVSIGRRLLVLLVEARSRDLTRDGIESLLRHGRELRDAGGFNRFRLVVVAEQGELASEVTAVDPEESVPWDGRVHLHRVTPGQVPAVLRRPPEVP